MLIKLLAFLLPRFVTDVAVLVEDEDSDEVGAYGLFFPETIQQVEDCAFVVKVRYFTVFHLIFNMKIVDIFEVEEVVFQ